MERGSDHRDIAALLHAPLTDPFAQLVIDAVIAAASSGRVTELSNGKRRP
ncbi:MAG: hypothetical protein M3P11_07285 [Actinomycetota bacterium]|nr:hypothetical protein [Actinomycetota bacterium]